MTHKRKDHTEKFCTKYWRWIITSRGDSTKQQLLNMALLTSSAAKAAKELRDQIFRFFQELREKQMQNQQQELRRDHRYEVSDRSIIYAVIYSEFSTDFLRILNCFF
jgi:hypothetical protein